MGPEPVGSWAPVPGDPLRRAGPGLGCHPDGAGEGRWAGWGSSGASCQGRRCNPRRAGCRCRWRLRVRCEAGRGLLPRQQLLLLLLLRLRGTEAAAEGRRAVRQPQVGWQPARVARHTFSAASVPGTLLAAWYKCSRLQLTMQQMPSGHAARHARRQSRTTSPTRSPSCIPARSKQGPASTGTPPRCTATDTARCIPKPKTDAPGGRPSPLDRPRAARAPSAAPPSPAPSPPPPAAPCRRPGPCRPPPLPPAPPAAPRSAARCARDRRHPPWCIAWRRRGGPAPRRRRRRPAGGAGRR